MWINRKDIEFTSLIKIEVIEILKNDKQSQLKDLVRHSRFYEVRQFGRTGQTDERIKVATWLQIYK